MTRSLNSTPKQDLHQHPHPMPPQPGRHSAPPANLAKCSTPVPSQHPQKQHPKATPAPAPCPQSCKTVASPSNSTCTSTANNTCTTTPNCMPPSTQPSISQKVPTPSPPPQTAPAQAPQAACPLASILPNFAHITSTSNRTPPAPGRQSCKHAPPPSISQITFPSLLEARTPISFSYLGKD